MFASGGVIDFRRPAGGLGWKGCPPEPLARCFMGPEGLRWQVELGSQAKQDGAARCLSHLPVPALQALSEEGSGKSGFGVCYLEGI